MRFAYYPGCASKGACPELNQSTRLVTEKLGIEIVELVKSSCCGAGVIGEADPDLQLALNARTFSQAEEIGLDIMTICGTGQGIMSTSNKRLKEEEGLLPRINGMLKEGQYNGRIDVKHLLWILVKDFGLERLKEMVVRPLSGIKVAPFYGCYILRPSSVLGFDDPEKPNSLESLIRILGAEPIDYIGKTKCCGFPIVLEKEDIALGMVSANILEAMDAGADCMVTPCPLCHMNLDIYQQKAGVRAGKRLSMPIIHLPQLVGLAIGIEPIDLGFSRHLASPATLLDKLGE